MDQWQEYIDAGSSAFSLGRYEESERYFLLALDVAEKSGTATQELFQILNDLALLYSLQAGKGAEAKFFYDRFMEVKKALEISDPPDSGSLTQVLGELGHKVNLDSKMKPKLDSTNKSNVGKPRILARYRRPEKQDEKPEDTNS